MARNRSAANSDTPKFGRSACPAEDLVGEAPGRTPSEVALGRRSLNDAFAQLPLKEASSCNLIPLVGEKAALRKAPRSPLATGKQQHAQQQLARCTASRALCGTGKENFVLQDGEELLLQEDGVCLRSCANVEHKSDGHSKDVSKDKRKHKRHESHAGRAAVEESSPSLEGLRQESQAKDREIAELRAQNSGLQSEVQCLKDTVSRGRSEHAAEMEELRVRLQGLEDRVLRGPSLSSSQRGRHETHSQTHSPSRPSATKRPALHQMPAWGANISPRNSLHAVTAGTSPAGGSSNVADLLSKSVSAALAAATAATAAPSPRATRSTSHDPGGVRAGQAATASKRSEATTAPKRSEGAPGAGAVASAGAGSVAPVAAPTPRGHSAAARRSAVTASVSPPTVEPSSHHGQPPHSRSSAGRAGGGGLAAVSPRQAQVASGLGSGAGPQWYVSTHAGQSAPVLQSARVLSKGYIN